MVLIGASYFGYLPFSEEQPAIFTMSALALVFAGIGVVVSAETLSEVAGDVDEIEKRTCPHCGADQ